jgi:hypothetical protein
LWRHESGRPPTSAFVATLSGVSSLSAAPDVETVVCYRRSLTRSPLPCALSLHGAQVHAWVRSWPAAILTEMVALDPAHVVSTLAAAQSYGPTPRSAYLFAVAPYDTRAPTAMPSPPQARCLRAPGGAPSEETGNGRSRLSRCVPVALARLFGLGQISRIFQGILTPF